MTWHIGPFLGAPEGGETTLLNVSDFAVGLEEPSLLSIALELADTLSGADSVLNAIEVALSESGLSSAAETVSAAAELSVSDSWVGSEVLKPLVQLALTETSAGADAVSVLTQTLVSILDTGSAADGIFRPYVQLSVAEAGIGFEAENLSARLSFSDSGAAADAFSASLHVQVADTATAVSAVALFTAQLATVLDAGVGLESVGLTVRVAVPEAASATEAFSNLAALLGVVEAGSGSEAAFAFNPAVRVAQIEFLVRPPMREVIEGSTSRVRMVFRDYERDPVIPEAVSYKILCLTTGTEIVPDTNLAAPKAEMEVFISPAENAIINSANPQEYRRIIVTATYAAGSNRVVNKFDYVVVNIRGE